MCRLPKFGVISGPRFSAAVFWVFYGVAGALSKLRRDRGSRVSVFDPVALPDYACYKVPYLFQSWTGRLIAFAEARGPIADPDSIGNCMDWDLTDVVSRFSLDGGRSWSSLQVVVRGFYGSHVVAGNLGVVQDIRTGRILLPFTRGNVEMHMTYSDDDGLSWTKPVRQRRYEHFLWTWVGFGPPGGIQLRRSERYRNRIVIPGYFSDSPVFDLTGTHLSKAFVWYSDDGGATFSESIVPNGPLGLLLGRAGNECQAVERDDGSILLSVRTLFLYRAQSFSYDGGETWSALQFTSSLFSPFLGCLGSVATSTFDSQIRLVESDLWSATEGSDRGLEQENYFSRKRALYYSGHDNPMERKGLGLFSSKDGGESWTQEPEGKLQAGPSGYSSLVHLLEGKLAVIYEAAEDLSGFFVPDHCWFEIFEDFSSQTARNGTRTGSSSGGTPVDRKEYGLFDAANRTTLWSQYLQHWRMQSDSGPLHDMSWQVDDKGAARFTYSAVWYLLILFDTIVLSWALFAVSRVQLCCMCLCWCCGGSARDKQNNLYTSDRKRENHLVGEEKAGQGPEELQVQKNITEAKNLNVGKDAILGSPVVAAVGYLPHSSADIATSTLVAGVSSPPPQMENIDNKDNSTTTTKTIRVLDESGSENDLGESSERPISPNTGEQREVMLALGRFVWTAFFSFFYGLWLWGIVTSLAFYHDDGVRWTQQTLNSIVGMLVMIACCYLELHWNSRTRNQSEAKRTTHLRSSSTTSLEGKEHCFGRLVSAKYHAENQADTVTELEEAVRHRDNNCCSSRVERSSGSLKIAKVPADRSAFTDEVITRQQPEEESTGLTRRFLRIMFAVLLLVTIMVFTEQAVFLVPPLLVVGGVVLVGYDAKKSST
ncbi:unnamed protein product [Amoebophrya sp. A25]|nr:unnamed protein product [Amoebophrya sp. A25]|eukprot:GSA25T00007170001.1